MDWVVGLGRPETGKSRKGPVRVVGKGWEGVDRAWVGKSFGLYRFRSRVAAIGPGADPEPDQ